MYLVSSSPKVVCIAHHHAFKTDDSPRSCAPRDGWGKALNPPEFLTQRSQNQPDPLPEPTDAA